jgi:hypothetical protein
VGGVLSHLIEPGVAVEKVVLAEDTPAIHLFPTTAAPHPVALLAHGVTASKETLFRFGEAMASAGFDSYTVDLPGHGQSRSPFSRSHVAIQLGRIAQAVGPVDVFIGHSMGAGAGAEVVRNGELSPKLFIAIGANPYLGEHGLPLLLLAGEFDELVPPATLKARSDARLVLSPWSDHALEVWDPRLVNAGVEAACGSVAKTPPPVPRFWLWRLAGLAFGMAGALVLIWCLPTLSPRLKGTRGILVSAAIILAVVLTTDTWVGSALNLHRIPLQVAIGVVIWLLLMGISKFGLPQWTLAALVIAFALACIIAQAIAPKDWGISFHLLSILGVITALFVCAGTVLGRMAARSGSWRDSDLALAIFVGYAIGQWLPRLF